MLEIFRRKDFQKVVLLFVIYKIFVISIAFSAQFIIPPAISHTQQMTDNIFLNPFAQYDGTAYLYIAQNGYTNDFGEIHQPNYHWYPLYPMLIRAFSVIGYDLAAFLIANIASFFAVTFFYLLAFENNKKTARRSVFFMLFFPTAYFLTMMYTEALFIALVTASFYYARRGQWQYAAIAGFLTALTRPQGILLFFPIAYIYARQKDLLRKPLASLHKIKLDVLYVFAVPLGTFLFMLYQYFTTGDFFIQIKSIAIGGVPRGGFPWDGYVYSIAAIFRDTTFINISYHIFNIFIMTFFLFLAYMTWKKLDREYFVYFAISLAVLLFSQNFFGIGRYLFVIFPAFMVMPYMEGRNKKLLYLFYAGFIAMTVFFVLLHATARFDSPLLYTPLF